MEIIANYYKFFLGNCRKIVLKIEIIIYIMTMIRHCYTIP